jgi:hypothetical protein
MSAALSFDELVRACDNTLGQHDVACPSCGPSHIDKGTSKRTVLRIYYDEENFIRYICQRCDAKGFARSGEKGGPADPAKLARVKLENEKRRADEAQKRQRTAEWLWCKKSRTAEGTVVQTYAGFRGIEVTLPETIRYLPPDRRNPYPAMITPFGLSDEPVPGVLLIPAGAVRGVHITHLRADGRGKAPIDPPKRMIGRSQGWPIVLAPLNDGLGLAIAEGIEDALSLHQATGLGAWAAGAAGRLPALVDKVPAYVESVTLATDDDPAGQSGCAELAKRLADRGFDVSFSLAGKQYAA